jgi:hypothetical protein
MNIGAELLTNPATNSIIQEGKAAGIDRRMSGWLLCHLKAAVVNFKNVFYSVACAVADAVLAVFAAIAAIFGEEGRNMLRAQLGHVLQDIFSIPVALFGIVFPRTAADVAVHTRDFTIKIFA